eukprot:3844006-Pyramimonas_sp.AAC.1
MRPCHVAAFSSNLPSKGDPRHEWPLESATSRRGDEWWPNPGAQAVATASRSAIGGPHWARLRRGGYPCGCHD